MKIEIFADAEALGEALATRLLGEIETAAAEGRRFLLGCPTGRSPLPTYRAMARRLAAEPRSLAGLVLVMMDEYLGGDAAQLRLAPSDAHFSCRGFAEREMREPWNAGLPDAYRLPAENVWFADPAEPLAIERRIAEAGGIDFFILASGAGDGHVAFNPPASPRDSRTRIVELAEQTRRDNMETFPAFNSLDEVPRFGISLGVGTIAQARAAGMILTGERKREAFTCVSAASVYDPVWPATIVAEMPGAVILADVAASGDASEDR